MINSINFKGNVFLTGSTNNLSSENEVQKMKEFADKNSCDVVVCNRDYYVGDKGVYDTILVKPNDTTGVNMFAKKTFNFQEPSKKENISFDYEI